MERSEVRIRSSAGGAFDCYRVVPDGEGAMPAAVLAATVTGVDEDLREIADEIGAHGCLVAAPDLFWRSIPGPLAREDARTMQRAEPRLEKIRTGEMDLADTLAHLRAHPRCNGGAAMIGFCYGGPYAILGPKRLGYASGIACHGTRMLDYIGEIEGMTQPVCILWGDRDHVAPREVLSAYRALPQRMRNVEVHVFPGVHHGYMMPHAPESYDARARDFSMQRVHAILDGLRN